MHCEVSPKCSFTIRNGLEKPEAALQVVAVPVVAALVAVVAALVPVVAVLVAVHAAGGTGLAGRAGHCILRATKIMRLTAKGDERTPTRGLSYNVHVTPS